MPKITAKLSLILLFFAHNSAWADQTPGGQGSEAAELALSQVPQMAVEERVALWKKLRAEGNEQLTDLEMVLLLNDPELTLPDVMASVSRSKVARLVQLAGSFQSVGKLDWSRRLTEIYQSLRSCEGDIQSAEFLSECHADKLRGPGDAVGTQALRLQAEIADELVRSNSDDAQNVIERLLRLDLNDVSTLDSRAFLIPALQKADASAFPGLRTRVLEERSLSLLRGLSRGDEPLARAVAQLCVTGAKDARATAGAEQTIYLLEQSFDVYRKGLPTRAALIAELSTDASVYSSPVLAQRLDALPVRPVSRKKQEPPPPASSSSNSMVLLWGALCLFFIGLFVGMGLYVVRRSAAKHATAGGRTEDEEFELRELLRFFGLSDNADHNMLVSSYHSAVMIHRSRNEKQEVQELERKYRRAVELLKR